MSEHEELGPIKKVLCGEHSPLGAVAEALVGDAKTCWCCSFWRGLGIGVGLTLGLVFIVAGMV